MKKFLTFLFIAFFAAPVFSKSAEYTLEDISDGLVAKEFTAYLQPVYSVYEGKITEAEVLSRWNKGGKIIPPGAYIPVLEKSELIKDFDLYMLALACSYVKQIEKSSGMAVPLAVNFSRYTLSQPGIVEEMSDISEAFGVDRSLIGIEITESFDLTSRKEAAAALAALKKKGFVTYIDDYGAGYTKLSDLKLFAPDILKLDKSFLPKDERLAEVSAESICKITKRAHKAGMIVICEGVETENQLDLLKKCGVDWVQGYLKSKPLPLKDFINKLKTDNKR